MFYHLFSRNIPLLTQFYQVFSPTRTSLFGFNIQCWTNSNSVELTFLELLPLENFKSKLMFLDGLFWYCVGIHSRAIYVDIVMPVALVLFYIFKSVTLRSSTSLVALWALLFCVPVFTFPWSVSLFMLNLRAALKQKFPASLYSRWVS